MIPSSLTDGLQHLEELTAPISGFPVVPDDRAKANLRNFGF
jgi:hypothetical protein